MRVRADWAAARIRGPQANPERERRGALALSPCGRGPRQKLPTTIPSPSTTSDSAWTLGLLREPDGGIILTPLRCSRSVVCYWRTYTNLLGSLYFNVGDARKPILAYQRRDCSGIRNSPTRRPSQLAGSRRTTDTAQAVALSFSAHPEFSSPRLHAPVAIRSTRAVATDCGPSRGYAFSEQHSPLHPLTRPIALGEILRRCWRSASCDNGPLATRCHWLSR